MSRGKHNRNYNESYQPKKVYEEKVCRNCIKFFSCRDLIPAYLLKVCFSYRKNDRSYYPKEEYH